MSNKSMFNPNRQAHKMVKHNQTIRRQQLTNCLSVFDHVVRLVLKEFRCSYLLIWQKIKLDDHECILRPPILFKKRLRHRFSIIYCVNNFFKIFLKQLN